MCHLEKNKLTLPSSSPELKSEIAANTGLNCQQNSAENRRLRPSWRSERDSNSRYGISFNVCAAPTLPTQNASANAISRGDSVAILEKQKAAPKGGFSI
jgi:hypothetical protein